MIRSKVTGLSELRAEVKAMRDEPAATLRAELDAIVAQTAERTRALIHHESGALAASVDSSSSMTGSTWRGEVSIGGPRARYAIYEFARKGHATYEPAWVVGEASVDRALGGHGDVDASWTTRAIDPHAHGRGEGHSKD